MSFNTKKSKTKWQKKKKVRRNKFNIIFFFFFIVKFNNSSIVISVNWFFEEKIPVNLRDNNNLLLLQLLDTPIHVVALVGLIAFSQSRPNDSWKILPKCVGTQKISPYLNLLIEIIIKKWSGHHKFKFYYIYK